MHLQVLASGSRGNAVLVRAGETHLLVDCGLAARELRGRLRAARYEPRRVDHILLSHGHLDHARSAGAISRRASATVHCAERLMRNRSVARAARLATLPVDGRVRLASGPTGERDPVEVGTAHLPHDAEPTVGFRIDHEGRVAVVLTDMGAPDAEVARRLSGAHVLVLEFNYDPAMLARGPYTDRLKRRIRGGRGHLSNAQAADMLTRLVGPELHTLVLAHISRHNNRPALALAAAREALFLTGRTDVQVVVAEQDEIGPNLRV